MIVRKEGKSDEKPTELLRYDVYLHKRRDANLIKHLEPFKLDRATNGEMRRLMYAGMNGRQPQQSFNSGAIYPQNEPSLPVVQDEPVFDGEPTTARSKLKRAFG